MVKGSKSQSSKKKPKSAHTVKSASFKVTKTEKEASKVSIARKSSKKQPKKTEATSESGKSGEDKSKTKDKPVAGGQAPTDESHSDTASLRALMVDVQFIKLTDVHLDASSGEDAIPSEGTIVGVLVLFHRADLKLLQPRVVLQGGLLGVMTTPMALNQVGLKVKKKKESSADKELTIARLVDDSPDAKSQLVVKFLLFDEKLYSHLLQVAYPFPLRSSFEPMVIPELAIQTNVNPLPAGQS